MSDENRNPIEQLTSQEFREAIQIRVYPDMEEYVVTNIGRIDYAVSITRGLAFTRPQLIERYRKATATYLVTRERGQ